MYVLLDIKLETFLRMGKLEGILKYHMQLLSHPTSFFSSKYRKEYFIFWKHCIAYETGQTILLLIIKFLFFYEQMGLLGLFFNPKWIVAKLKQVYDQWMERCTCQDNVFSGGWLLGLWEYIPTISLYVSTVGT